MIWTHIVIPYYILSGTFDLWHIIFDHWPLKYDICSLTYEHSSLTSHFWSLTFASYIWLLITDFHPLTPHIWSLYPDLWPLTFHIYPLTPDYWHMISNLWTSILDLSFIAFISHLYVYIFFLYHWLLTFDLLPPIFDNLLLTLYFSFLICDH